MYDRLNVEENGFITETDLKKIMHAFGEPLSE
jgi:Ca2+-binding EF-hand superfamily protein